jgi:hypothetical protein
MYHYITPRSKSIAYLGNYLEEQKDSCFHDNVYFTKAF